MKHAIPRGIPAAFLIMGMFFSCATDSSGVQLPESQPAVSKPELQQHSVYYSPWPAGVDGAFRDGAFIATADMGFSHAPDWLFSRTDSGGARGLLLQADDLQGVIVVQDYTANSPDGIRRFLTWLDASEGSVVWSDETTAAVGPLYLGMVVAGDVTTGALWTGKRNREVVLRITGSRESVENRMPQAIQLMKTVELFGEGDSSPDEVRQLPGGLRFQQAETEWRWQEDLLTGFLLDNPLLETTVAVWLNEDRTYGFDVVDGDVSAAELEAMFVRNLAVRGTGEVD